MVQFVARVEAHEDAISEVEVLFAEPANQANHLVQILRGGLIFDTDDLHVESLVYLWAPAKSEFGASVTTILSSRTTDPVDVLE